MTTLELNRRAYRLGIVRRMYRRRIMRRLKHELLTGKLDGVQFMTVLYMVDFVKKEELV